MKWVVLTLLMFTSLQSVAEKEQDQLLKEFHNYGITHCDEFISKNTVTPGNWKFFINKHPGGIDGSSTEVFLTQISGKPGQTFKTSYTFIQTLKQCFLHKKGQITAFDNCDKAVDPIVWSLEYNLPGFDYKRYKDNKGIILYAKEIELNGKKACLLDYEFRTKGNQSIHYK